MSSVYAVPDMYDMDNINPNSTLNLRISLISADWDTDQRFRMIRGAAVSG